ncbi:MAG: methyltransferase domain-containing protein [Candidatus Pacebacteria bacterium]|nr:methyltransferase domain-containing protein [Candidatus Paceibacterota bacterium]
MNLIHKLKVKIKEYGFWGTTKRVCRYFHRYTIIVYENFLRKFFRTYANIATKIEKSIQWAKNNVLQDGGISVSTKERIAYPEVSGYFIPTLYQWGEKKLAKALAQWLISQQNKDGSFSAPDGIPYTFDTGQVIRGFLTVINDMPQVKQPLIKACDWLIKQIDSNGKINTPSLKMWNNIADDRIHLYVLSQLVEAGKKLNKKKYIQSAYRALEYYKKREDLLEFNTLSHFYGYILEALYDLEEYDLVNKALKNTAKIQRKNGGIFAYPDSSWVCIPGTAQLAIVFYKAGMIKNGNKALRFLEKVQNSSGGFYGSIGLGADYFPFEEISWAVKFYLDACYWRIKASFDKNFDIFPETIDINEGRIQEIISFFGDINNKKVIDIGCGKGRFMKKLKLMFPSADLYGIDISEKMLQFDDSKQFNLSVENMLNINYPQSFFDFVYCVESLEHAIRIERAIEEMCRILKPGGKIVIIDKNIEKLGKMKIDPWEQWFKAKDVLEMLSRNKIKAEVKYITYENYKKLDGLFLAWKGKKYE